jgi:hypothetical protein
VLRAALLLALAACAAAAACPPGRENSVDGVQLATDTVSVSNVAISGCNNTVTRDSATPSAPVTITGSDDVVLQNIGATSVTVTGDFNSVARNDVSQTGAHTIRVAGDANTVESNRASQIWLDQATSNIMSRNQVAAGDIQLRGAFRNYIVDNSVTGTANLAPINVPNLNRPSFLQGYAAEPSLELDYNIEDNFIVNNSMQSFRAEYGLTNSTFRDNVIADSIYSALLTSSSTFIANTAQRLWTMMGAVGNTLIGNTVAGAVWLQNGARFNTAVQNQAGQLTLNQGVTSNSLTANVVSDPKQLQSDAADAAQPAAIAAAGECAAGHSHGAASSRSGRRQHHHDAADSHSYRRRHHHNAASSHSYRRRHHHDAADSRGGRCQHHRDAAGHGDHRRLRGRLIRRRQRAFALLRRDVRLCRVRRRAGHRHRLYQRL